MSEEIAAIRQIGFNADGVGNTLVTKAPEDGLHPLPETFESDFAPRYKLVDGEVIDAHPGKTDEQVMAMLAQLEAERDAALAAAKAAVARANLTKLKFMQLFTDAELEAIYSAAKTSVAVEVYLDKLKLAENVDLTDPATIAGIDKLQAVELLTAERAARIKAGLAPLPVV